MKRARYYNLSDHALEFLDMAEDSDCALFMRWFIRAVEGLYEGNYPALPDNPSKLLEKAVKAQIEEMVDGFEKYQKRATGNRGTPTVNNPPTNGLPMPDQWSTNDRPNRINENEEETKKEEEETKLFDGTLSSFESFIRENVAEFYQTFILDYYLSINGITQDEGFEQTYKKHGFFKVWFGVY